MAAPGQAKCKECHAKYMREWRSKRVNLLLDDDNYEHLRVRSFQEHKSLSWLINDTLRRDRDREQVLRDQAIERGITRMARGGGGNVSRETKRA